MKFKKYLKLLTIPICIFITSNLYAIDPLSKPPQTIGQYPGIFFGVRGMVGTSNTFVISIGDTPMTGSGSTGYMGTNTVGADQYAGLRYNGTTNKWQFKGTDTATWDDISSITISYLDTTFIKQVNGTGSGQILTDMTQNGGTQSGNINSTATYTMNGATISPTELSYLDNLSDNIQNQINLKENSANKGIAGGYSSLDSNSKVVQNPATATETSGNGKIPIQTVNGLDSWLIKTYINSIRGSSGNVVEGQFDIILEGDIVGTSTYDVGQKKGTQTIALSAGASNRPNILEGGSVFGTQSTEINFDTSDFDGTQSASRSTLSLSAERKGTTSSAVGYTIKQDDSGKVPSAVRPDYVSYVEINSTSATGTVHIKTDDYITHSFVTDNNGSSTITFKSLSRYVVYGTNSTFTVPSNTTKVYVTMIGAGGGGGGGLGNSSEAEWCGGGGGAGQPVINYPLTVVAGTPYNITIGVGGNGGSGTNNGGAPGGNGNNGNSGGATSFGALLTVSGGGGGGGGNAGSGGSGGSSGNNNLTGLTGQSGFSGGISQGGTGGWSYYGVGGIGGTKADPGNPGTSSVNTSGYGAGGGGGGASNAGNGADGGNGLSGICIVAF